MSLEKKLGRAVTALNREFGLFGPGQRVMVGVSGGKDSWTMLHLLMRAQRQAPFAFELLAFHLDQGHPGFPVDVIRRRFESLGVPWQIERQDTYSIVEAKLQPDKTPCALCSRLRRGILYAAARRHGCDRIALGHHREDLIETLLLNLFYGGNLQTMPPKLRNDAGDVLVIRPLARVAEADIAAFATEQGFPIIPCLLCGRGKDLKRKRMAELMDQLDEQIPGVRASMLTAMANVHVSHLLDPSRYDHRALG